MDPDRELSQYVHNRWSVDQGFPGGSVSSIAQTADGYLWIGSERGLVRFDGVNFRLFNHANTPSLPAGQIFGLATSHEGDLWIRMQDPALVRYRNGGFEVVSPGLAVITTPITAMFRQHDGDLLYAALGNKIFRYHNGKLVPSTFHPKESNFLALTIAETRDGVLWLGTRDSGIFSVAKGASAVTARGLADRRITCLLPNGANQLWIGTATGLFRWDGTTFTQDGIAEPMKRGSILSLFEDHESNLWVGTSDSLIRQSPRGTAVLHNQDNGPVSTIFEDREGNLWTGGPQGIERFRDSLFVTYATAARPPENNGSVYIDKQNRLWFAPSDGGLFWLRGMDIERVPVAGLNQDLVYSISGGDGELWIGRQRGGLTRLVEQGGSFSATTYSREQGLAPNPIYTVLRSRDGSVWAGTINGGVSHYRNGRFTNYTSENGLASNSVSFLLETSDGIVWVATSNGLNAFSNGHWQVFTGGQGLPSGHLNCLMEDSDQTLWIGASEGLAFLRSGRIQIPNPLPEALREDILGIAQGSHDELWIATSSRVLRVNGNKLLNGSSADIELREYGIQDGLLSTEGVKRDRCVIKDSRGRIWFSLNRGLSVVNPDRLMNSPAPPMVHLQTLSADGNSFDPTHPVRIPSDSQRIIFSYTGLSLAEPERLKYRYRLDGLDHEWSAPTANTEAGYSNLHVGSYRFRVTAGNADGLWSTAEAAVALDVEPMLWQTWWFDAAVVLACLLFILGFYRYRMRQLTSHLNLRFEERLMERTRIAQELHDTLLQGVLSASMQLHIAVDDLPPDSPVNRPLSNVLQILKQVIDEGRNTVQGLRSSYSGPRDLGQAFSAISNEFAVPPGVAFRVVVVGQPRVLHPVLRDEAYRIGREALVNAFRHSKSTSVEVELEYTDKSLGLFVRDNGCGIDPHVLRSGREGHFGLCGMRERAERIGARFRLWSSPGAGTEIELVIPGRIAYQFVSPGRMSGWYSWVVRKWRPDEKTSEPVTESKGESSR
jgi:signal transduction histidine kinase/ligand-binding sensor domain-containing protein